MDLSLFVDFGSTYTKAAVIDLAKEEIKLVVRSKTTLRSGLMEGLERALEEIYAKLGCRPDFKNKMACSSAAGGLKMVAIGLVKNLTAEAAKRAALGAGARVMKVFAHELSSLEVQEIDSLQPDIVLLAGGTDGGNKEVLLHNARMLSQLAGNPPIIVAGNKAVAPEAAQILLDRGFEAVVVDNVMPELNRINVEAAGRKIREIFINKIIEAKGFQQVESFMDGILMPTPAAVLNAAKLLAEGTGKEAGWGELMAVDPGGATTDVYSVAEGAPTKDGIMWKGMPEPKVKRTVEGDLGMRHSAKAALESLAGRGWCDHVEWEALVRYVDLFNADPAYLPAREKEFDLEAKLGMAIVEMAVERHAGYLETSYGPMGAVFLQHGKDLTRVKHVIGTGGIIANHCSPELFFQKVCFDPRKSNLLKPKEPHFWLDKQQIMAALGLVAEIDADKALRMLKKYLVSLGGSKLGSEK